jgi:hypothetical protein
VEQSSVDVRGDVALNIQRAVFQQKRVQHTPLFSGFLPQGHLRKLGSMFTRMGMGQEQHVVNDRRHAFKFFQIGTQ